MKNILILFFLVLAVVFQSGTHASEMQSFSKVEQVQESSYVDGPTEGQGLEILEFQTLKYSQSCCKVCTRGKACGDSCISAMKRCRKGVGCACDG